MCSPLGGNYEKWKYNTLATTKTFYIINLKI